MKITLHLDGHLIVRQGLQVAYSADQARVESDCPSVFPDPPAGFASATYDTETGLAVGYDAFGNATPGIDWPAARRVATAAEVLVKAHEDRIVARSAAQEAMAESMAARRLAIRVPRGTDNG